MQIHMASYSLNLWEHNAHDTWLKQHTAARQLYRPSTKMSFLVVVIILYLKYAKQARLEVSNI